MTSVFLDTSFVIALEAADDQYHKLALKQWKSLITSLPTLVTTSYVFDEVVTFFNSRNLQAKAVEIGSRLLDSPTVELVYVDKTLFKGAWQYLRQHSDKSYSLTDCVSFIIMEQQKIQTALTFDKHFLQAGFNRLP